MVSSNNSLYLIGVICLIMGIFSCGSNKESQSDPVKSMYDKFVKLRYDGKFKSNPLFSEEIQSQIESAPSNYSETRLLEYSIEWHLDNGNDEIAQQQLMRLADVHSPESNGNYRWLVSYYHTVKNEKEEAISLLHSIINNRKSDLILLLKSNYLLGSIYDAQKVDSLAMFHFGKAKEIGPLKGDIDYYLESVLRLGNILFENDEINESEVLYTRVLDESRQHDVRRLIPISLFHLAKVAESQGDNQKALAYYKNARNYILEELGKENDAFLSTLAEKIENLE